jgi:hypothetical protein
MGCLDYLHWDKLDERVGIDGESLKSFPGERRVNHLNPSVEIFVDSRKKGKYVLTIGYRGTTLTCIPEESRLEVIDILNGRVGQERRTSYCIPIPLSGSKSQEHVYIDRGASYFGAKYIELPDVIEVANAIVQCLKPTKG